MLIWCWAYLGIALVFFVVDMWWWSHADHPAPPNLGTEILTILAIFLLAVVTNFLWPIAVIGYLIRRAQRKP